MMLYALGFFLVLLCWGFILVRWQRGIVMLLIYMPVAGVVTLSLYPSSIPTLFKDFFFVIPAYLAFFASRQRRVSTEQVPASVRSLMLALAAMVLVQSFNPYLANWMVAAIGAKIWLFYLPLIFMGLAMIESRDDLVRLLRLMVVITWIPCGVGIVQWMSSMTFGYQETMIAFYGDAAEGATQQFVVFDVGGEFFRIPSTFTFVTQYFGYTLAMVVPAYALMKLDASGLWRKFAAATLGLAVLASFMSGARAAYLFIPLLLMLVYFLDDRVKGGLKVALMLPVVLLTAMYLAGIDPLKMFNMMQELTLNYSDEIAKQGLLDAIVNSPLGTGTGMNTGPARYAFDDPGVLVGIENYYAKAVVELGVVGLVIVVALFLVLIRRGYEVHRQIRDAGLRSCSAAFLAFIIVVVLNSFKGWQIDLDPVNVYFWLFSGFLLKLGYLDRLSPVSSANCEEAEAGCRTPATGMPRPT
jgi:O-antigen ligase